MKHDTENYGLIEAPRPDIARSAYQRAPSDCSPAETTQLFAELGVYLSRIPVRERRVLTLRFGMEDGVERTLKECGEQLGIGPERARQLESRGLAYLRRMMLTPEERSRVRRPLQPGTLEGRIADGSKRGNAGEQPWYHKVVAYVREKLRF